MLSVDTMSLFTTPSLHFYFPCPCIAYHSVLLRSILLRSMPPIPLPFLGLPWPTPILLYPSPSLFSSLLFSSLLFSSLLFSSLLFSSLPLSIPSPLLTFAFTHSLCCWLQSTTQQRVRLCIVPVLAHLSYMQPLVRPSGHPAPCGCSSEECSGHFLFPRHLEFLQISSSEEVTRSRHYDLIPFLFMDKRWRKHLKRLNRVSVKDYLRGLY